MSKGEGGRQVMKVRRDKSYRAVWASGSTWAFYPERGGDPGGLWAEGGK